MEKSKIKIQKDNFSDFEFYDLSWDELPNITFNNEGKDLFPHNQGAYEKVIEIFKTHQKTCICHPTGTGKGVIAAAVAKHFNKVLILGPSKAVLRQTADNVKDTSRIVLHTYQYLLKNEITQHFDLIVLDEFHRLGAPIWGKKVAELLSNNPNAKVLGLSATPVRKIDNERNMAEELFNSNTASYMRLSDALEDNILPTPVYVQGLIDITNSANQIKKLIKRTRKLTKKDKQKRILRLERIKLDWSKTRGIVNVLKKYIPKDSKKILVFCDRISSIKPTIEKLNKWFTKAKIPVNNIYYLHSKQRIRTQKAVFESIEKEQNRKGAQIIVSVNMLNEGIHMDNVTSVLFLRKTESPNVFLQQLGRCLVAQSNTRPIVLDMVNNLNNSKYYDYIDSIEYTDKAAKQKKKQSLAASNFTVIDLLVDDYKLLAGLVQDIIVDTSSFEERLKRIQEFIKNHNRLPSSKNVTEYCDLLNWRALRKHHTESSEVRAIIEQYGSIKDTKLRLQQLIDFCKENNRLPTRNKKSSQHEKLLYGIFWKHKDEFLQDKEFKKLYKKLHNPVEKLSFDYCYPIVLKYCDKYKKLPTRSANMDEEARKAACAYQYLKVKCKDRKELTELRTKYSKTQRGLKGRRNIERVEDFVSKNGYLPFSKQEDYKAAKSWEALRTYFNKHQVVKDFVTKMVQQFSNKTKQIISERRSEISQRIRNQYKTLNND